MKIDKTFTWLEGTLTGFFLSFSAMACLASAFSMGTVSFWLLGLLCLAAAALWSFFCSRRLGLILWLLLALIAGILWQKGYLAQGVESLLYKVSRVYHNAYNWKIVRWSFRDVDQMEPTLAPMIYLLGMLLAALTAWTICRGEASIIALLPAALPVAACFVVTDTVPKTGYLVVFLTTAVVMLLSSLARQTDRAQGRRLAAAAAIPVFLAVGILFLSVPRQTYYRQEQAKALHDLFLGKYTLAQTWDKLTGKQVQLETKNVDLAAVGIRRQTDTKVLEVTTRYSGGVLYLRAAGLGAYTGTQWQENEMALPELYWPNQTVSFRDEVAIRTRYAHEMLYLPYYAVSVDTEGMGRGLRNTKKLNEYSVTRMITQPQPDAGMLAQAVTPGQQVQMEIAARLPESTKKWATPLAKSIVAEEKSVYYQAQRIADYVKNSARYDQNTPKMPAGKKDFAQWFLEESDKGYCVHFATAGTVLLKALGIPARYTSGYLVETTAGVPTQVTAAQAHAWVEYWLPGFGWTVLECTPSAEEPDLPPNTEETGAPEVEQTLPTGVGGFDPNDFAGEAQPDMTWLWYPGAFMLLLAILWVQRKLRLSWKDCRCRKGDNNAKALARWEAAEQLSGYLGKEPPQRLLQLAQKAKFSPYILTDEELREFDGYLLYTVQRLKKQNVFYRLWHQWVLGLY